MLLALYISNVNCDIVCPAQVNVVQRYIIRAWEIYTHAFHTGNVRALRVISDSPALRLFIYSPMSDPHPSTHHLKSVACHLKVKGINSPPLHWGSASIHSSLKNLLFALWLPLSRMPMSGSDEWATPVGIVLSCWDLVCWIMSCVLGVHMDRLGTMFKGGKLLIHHRLFHHLEP